jgi:hypothetical protein
MRQRWLIIAAALALVAAAAQADAAPRSGNGVHFSGGHGGGGHFSGARAGGMHFGGAHFRGAQSRAGHFSARHSAGTVHFRGSYHNARTAVSHPRRASESRRNAARTHAVRNRSVATRRAEARRNEVRRTEARRHAVALRHERIARQGRFASHWYRQPPHWRVAYRPWRWAWRRGWYAGYVGWYGPLFWPYAYADIFGFAFWPWGYVPGYWDYAYDDFFDGIYYGDAGYVPGYAAASSGTRVARAPKASETAVAELCKQPGQGVTAFPFGEITQKVKLTDEQKPLFDDFQSAAKQAADAFAASCPADGTFPSTVPGRLDMITARLQATDNAVLTVKPALDKFYASLSDEQKERFNALGPKQSKAVAARGQAETTGSAADDEKRSCGEPKSGLTNLPIEQIKAVVKPTDAQQADLKDLQDATDQAVGRLQAACPDAMPLTPPGRLDAMDQRLKAMIDAANTVKPALDKFYASLSDEQKARFDRLGRDLPEND